MGIMKTEIKRIETSKPKRKCYNCKNMNDIGYIPLQEKFN